MRWIAVTVFICAELVLLGMLAANTFGGGIPFATDYAPQCYGGVIALGMLSCGLALIGAWHLHGRGAVIASTAAMGVLVAMLVAYVAYHAHHPTQVHPDGFRGYLVPVIPYHQQLALPCFVTLASIAAIFASAVPMPFTRAITRRL
jgi:hypothetical protein